MYGQNSLFKPVTCLAKKLLHLVTTDVAFGMQLPENLLCYPDEEGRGGEGEGKRRMA